MRPSSNLSWISSSKYQPFCLSNVTMIWHWLPLLVPRLMTWWVMSHIDNGEFECLLCTPRRWNSTRLSRRRRVVKLDVLRVISRHRRVQCTLCVVMPRRVGSASLEVMRWRRIRSIGVNIGPSSIPMLICPPAMDLDCWNTIFSNACYIRRSWKASISWRSSPVNICRSRRKKCPMKMISCSTPSRNWSKSYILWSICWI